MGWCGGSDIYVAIADVFDPVLEKAYYSLEDGSSLYLSIISNLEDQDWDCQDDALETLKDKNRYSYRALAKCMGINLNCKGRCQDVSCEGENYCGCACHYE